VQHCAAKGITLVECNVGLNQEPFLHMSESAVAEAVAVLADPAARPVLVNQSPFFCCPCIFLFFRVDGYPPGPFFKVFCSTGRSKTGVVVACYRRRRLGWALASVLQEYEQYTDPDGGLADMTFVETFRG